MQLQDLTQQEIDGIIEDIGREQLRQSTGLEGRQISPLGRYEAPVPEGLPEHFAYGYSEQETPQIRADKSLTAKLGSYIQQLGDDAREAHGKRQADGRTPLKRFGDYILFGTPEYEGAEEGVADALATAIPRFAVQGGASLKEGVEEGDPLKTLGGAGMLAASALPLGGKLAAKAFSSIPRGAIAGGTIGALPDLASGAYSPDIALAEEDVLQGLYQQKAGLSRQRQEALSNMEAEARTGRGPRYEAAKQRYDQLSTQLQALDQQIQFEQEKTSPKAKLELEQLRQEGEDDRATKLAGRPFRERHPYLSKALPIFAGAISGGLGSKAGLTQSRQFNKAADQLSDAWQNAINKARRPDDLLEAAHAARASQHYPKQMDALQNGKLGERLIPSPEMQGALVANELAFLAPPLYDKFTTAPNSPAYQEAEQALSPEGLLTRLASGGALGAAAYKVGKGFTNHKRKPQRFDAETEALKPVVEHRGGPLGYYKKHANDDLLDVEQLYASRRQRRQDADAVRQAEQALLRTRKGRQGSHQENDIPRQEQQTHRRSRHPEPSDLPLEPPKKKSKNNNKNSTFNQYPANTRRAAEKRLKEGHPISTISKKYGVPQQTLRRWKKLLDRVEN